MVDDNISNILTAFNIQNINIIEKIHNDNTWNINDKYILKRYTDKATMDKSILLSTLLSKISIPVPRYIQSIYQQPYVSIRDENYCLMDKTLGEHLDPFCGDYSDNGIKLGNVVATLHLALKKIQPYIECYNCNNIHDLRNSILVEFKKKDIDIDYKIIDICINFEDVYGTLPRQPIHRDIYSGNLLFDNGIFTGYLDFDSLECNVRIFDICYLGASMLVETYQDTNKLEVWKVIFSNILHGYNNISPLLPQELSSIPIMFVLIELIFTAWYSSTGKPKAVVSARLDMVNWIYKNQNQIPDEIFL